VLAKTETNDFGQKYSQIATVQSADGTKSRRIKLAWINRIDEPNKVRLITVIPPRRNRGKNV